MNRQSRRPEQRFLAGALIAIGWLIIALGGLCVVGQGFLGLIYDDVGFDWLAPFIFVIAGLPFLWAGHALHARLKRDGLPGD